MAAVMPSEQKPQPDHSQMTEDPSSTRNPTRLMLNSLLSPEKHRIKSASYVTSFAALLWLPQAALIAAVFSDLLLAREGTGVPLWGAVCGFVILAMLRLILSYWAEGRLFAAAQAIITAQRSEILNVEARRSDVSHLGGPGAMAALSGEKLDALTPYITRYSPAQTRVMIVPLVILACAFWQSWAVGIVFLIAGPLIPVFMALIGMAAQSASEKHMAELGSLSDLLVDRVAALSDIQLLGATPRLVDQFQTRADDLRARTMEVLKIAFLSSTVLELLAAIGVAMVAVWVGFSLLGELSWGSYGTGITPWGGIFLLLLAPDYFQPLRDLHGGA